MRGREIKIENLTYKEKGYLFGLFEGDGYKVYDKKSRHYQVEFYLNSEKDKKIIEFVVRLLYKIGLKANLYQDKRYNCKRIRVYSKNLFNIIDKNMDLSKETKDFKLGYVSGMIDSEGHVNRKKSYIMIVSTDKKTLGKCANILSEINISSSINKRVLNEKDKLFSYRMYISVNFKNKAHLSIKAGKLSR